MKESPIFQHVESAGMTSAKPLTEAFTKWSNLPFMHAATFTWIGAQAQPFGVGKGSLACMNPENTSGRERRRA
jgi:hypothetical protein